MECILKTQETFDEAEMQILPRMCYVTSLIMVGGE